jgi:hypothetical protein
MRFCCSIRERFLFPAEWPNETRLAKLSPVDAGGFDGELERFDVADKGVDLPEPPFDGILGNKYPELMGGGLFDLLVSEDQLKPFRSSMLRLSRSCESDVGSSGVGGLGPGELMKGFHDLTSSSKKSEVTALCNGQADVQCPLPPCMWGIQTARAEALARDAMFPFILKPQLLVS